MTHTTPLRPLAVAALVVLALVAGTVPAAAKTSPETDALTDLEDAMEDLLRPVHAMDELGEVEPGTEAEATEDAYDAVAEAREEHAAATVALDEARATLGGNDPVVRSADDALAETDRELTAAEAALDEGDLQAAAGHFAAAERSLESALSELESRIEAGEEH